MLVPIKHLNVEEEAVAKWPNTKKAVDVMEERQRSGAEASGTNGQEVMDSLLN